MAGLKIFPFKVTVLALYLMAMSCSAQPQVTIQGKIKMEDGWKPMVYLVHPRQFSEVASDYLGEVVDSAQVASDGTIAFRYAPKDAESDLYFLTMQRESSRFATHLDDSDPTSANYMPVVFDPTHPIHFTATSSNFQQSFTLVSPSRDNIALLSLNDIHRIALQAYLTQQALREDNDTLLLEHEKEFLGYANPLIHFADSTSSMYAAMVAIRWISPAGDYERFPEFIYRQCKKWSSASPDHPLVAGLCQATKAGALPVMIGDVLPDYKLPMVNGDTLSVNQLLGKKLTIVDIWASWCAPCRKENRAVLVPLWEQYKTKGLQIIGYSIDSDKNAWQNAVLKDGAAWAHASHLTGDETPFLQSLRITTIPANYILDETGKVVAKNVYGEDLQKLVREYLEK